MFSFGRSTTIAPILWVLGILGVAGLRWGSPTVGWSLLGLAAALVLLLPAIADPPGPNTLSPRVEYAVLFCVLLATTFFRLWRLPELPPGCWADEAENGLETLRILRGDWFVFTPDNGGRGCLHFFWAAPFFALRGPNVVSLRLASAVMGIATIPAVWCLLRQYDSARTALWGAGLLALSTWHVTISRIGFDAIMTPLFDTLVVLAVVRACRTGSLLWFGLAGLVAGLANYGYAASRLTPVLAVTAFLVFMGTLAPRQRLWGAAVAFAVFSAVLAPLAHYAWQHPDDVLKRVRHVSLLGVAQRRSFEPLLQRVGSTMRLLHQEGDDIARHNLPDRPMLDPITGLMFLAGLGVAWRRRWQRKFVFMLLWLALVFFFGSVLTDGAEGLRTISALVPICFFAAWGWQAASSRIQGASAVVAATALAALVGVGAYRAYFVDYAGSSQVRRAFSPRGYAVGEYVRQELPGRTVVLSEQIERSVVQFVGRQDGAGLVSRPTQLMKPHDGAVFVLAPYEQMPRWARKPSYEWHTQGGPGWREQFTVIRGSETQ